MRSLCGETRRRDIRGACGRRVGESAAKDEMCMAIGYYFPAASSTFCLNSVPLSP